MNIDWNPIILAIVTVLFSWETISNIIYRRENRKLKQNEVKTSDVDAQKAQIELGELFMQKAGDMFKQMQELQEQTLIATKKNGIDNEDIIKQIKELKDEQKKIAEEQKRIGDEQLRQCEELKRLGEGQDHLVTFLNGEYQDFLSKNGFKKRTKKQD